MSSLNLTPILILIVAYLIYYIVVESQNQDQVDFFVPSNSYEAPDESMLSQNDWKTLNEKFGRMISIVNKTTYSMAYQLDDMINAFGTVINNLGMGKFSIISVEKSLQFSLINVVVQDLETLAITKFARVDFIVESMNPFKIHKIMITADAEFKSSQNVLPQDNLKPDSLFRIKNPLHLFYPYSTSDDEMNFAESDKVEFEKAVNAKAAALQNYSGPDISNNVLVNSTLKNNVFFPVQDALATSTIVNNSIPSVAATQTSIV